jgi:hypothetical protein
MANSANSDEARLGVASSSDRQPVADDWAHLAYCPNCGALLEKRQCKARCMRCGFFQDCSDTIV